MKKTSKIFIGIDPDVDKSGVAYYVSSNKKLTLKSLTFFDLLEYLKKVKKNFSDVENVKLTVVIEGGWLNKSNWHVVKNGTAAVNAKIGSHVGENHEVGRKIVEMCQYLNINHIVVTPRRTKVKEEYFKMLTGYKARTNQEKRDAALLVWGM